MKHKGIAIISILAVFLVLISVFVALMPERAEAASYLAKTYILPFNGEAAKTIVMRDRVTGYLINASTGVCSSSVEWDDAEIAGSNLTESNDWSFSIPAHSVDNIFYTYYDVAAASVAKTTSPSGDPVLYNPDENMSHSDENPLKSGKVWVFGR